MYYISTLVLFRQDLEDSIRIKNKMLDDQNSTIQQLKQAKLNLEEELADVIQKASEVEKELTSHMNRDDIYQEEIEAGRDKIAELENQLEDYKYKFKTCRDKNGELQTRIDELLKVGEEAKERIQKAADKMKQMEIEKSQAIKESQRSTQLQTKLDSEFRKQLHSQSQCYEEQLEVLRHERDVYIANANRKVEEVENEMRALLQERITINQKYSEIEDQLTKMTTAFVDLKNLAKT
ncbi:uncharacterized protein TRIADDRAFT_52612 [Trichoplax adhaerens]|uniref:Uncharacterized protein n=1 Tax=Trichoplax adhaerens TaxID=10228 RepID=B3RJG0_TRIAD|nr:hypothetical protein TRIADDRAFT_52612 [Trichoplax adhaerens]EDV29088.1 hypothetical protein TRIADDRAFT_52612 [Trichoplax adhaerens]|eukprot:XP_002108290.1 hypothetical protein TRIADDRAFT_52612 [Trichoplax adhaerens]